MILTTADGSEDAAMEALRAGAAEDVLEQELGREPAAGGRRRTCPRSTARQESSYEIGNDLGRIPPLLDILRDEMARLGRFDSSELMRTLIAVDEALRNAVCHGNLEVSSELREGGGHRFDDEVRRRSAVPPFRDRRIRLRVAHDPDRTTFVVRDEGPGFDTSRIDRAIEPEDLIRSSGRGLLLMKSFMDQVSFNRAGNEVTLVKRCRAGAAAPGGASPSARSGASPGRARPQGWDRCEADGAGEAGVGREAEESDAGAGGESGPS
ncbi:serine-protein kinase RsbW [Aquisphaera giovannonii]|uniref:Serine-protein kinase RsbW n=1 Tax=Aquisphaera giovannonii TaxID=406548 RepID=A0A5B9W639_9BACT|nr:ATP-binding protein [Aquisphaera giovannonii]QEH35440.1 serine-protein kinase RsbW [Aquisphaera giovannonii]